MLALIRLTFWRVLRTWLASYSGRVIRNQSATDQRSNEPRKLVICSGIASQVYSKRFLFNSLLYLGTFCAFPERIRPPLRPPAPELDRIQI